MISVPCGTGDICFAYDIPFGGDIRLRRMKERILYHARRKATSISCRASARYIIRRSRISFDANNKVSRKRIEDLTLLVYNENKRDRQIGIGGGAAVMAQQNIFDNEIFFTEYRKLRERENNANNLFETPALISLLPELKGKTILDIKTPRLIQFNYPSADFAA